MNTGIQYSAKDIAPFFIKKGVSPLKLQKLLYYSQTWSFVLNGKCLFQDEIKGWIYGPVVPDIWYRFRFMRRSDVIPINNHFYELKDNLDDHTNHLLTEIWSAYGHLSGADLVDLTHQEGPWKRSRLGLLSNQPGNVSVLINADTTKEYQCTSFGKIPVAEKSQSLGQFNS
jgi:uncharacterized phage-associated protein